MMLKVVNRFEGQENWGQLKAHMSTRTEVPCVAACREAYGQVLPKDKDIPDHVGMEGDLTNLKLYVSSIN